MKLSGETITSRQNRTVIEVGKLADRRTREERRCFRFDGIKLTVEAVRQGVELPLILLREADASVLVSRIEEQTGKPIEHCAERVLLLSDAVFDKISEEKAPEGVICVAKYIDKSKKIATIYSDGKNPPLSETVVLLESVRDPSNIGAIIRSAAAIGIDRLILSDDCADAYNAKAVRASMGTLFGQRIDRVGDLPGVVRQLQASGRRVYAAALDPQAERLGGFAVRRGDCVIVGNEGHGLSQAILAATDKRVFIPMSDRAESFNAAVAAALLMWEFAKGVSRLK